MQTFNTIYLDNYHFPPPSYSERRPKSIIEKSNHRKENICETRSEIKINLNQFDFREDSLKRKQKQNKKKNIPNHDSSFWNRFIDFREKKAIEIFVSSMQ